MAMRIGAAACLAVALLVLCWVSLSADDAGGPVPPLPARQAVQWLRRWVDYSAAQERLWMSDVASAGDPSLEQVGQRLQRLVALRRAHFGAEAARTLFAAQEQADAELLASLTTR